MKRFLRYSIIGVVSLMCVGLLWGQEPVQGSKVEEPSYFWFYVNMLESVVIVVLAWLIIRDGKVFVEKNLSEKGKLGVVFLLGMGLFGTLEAKSEEQVWYDNLNYVLMTIAFVQFIIIVFLGFLYATVRSGVAGYVPKREGKLSWWEKVNALVPQEEEHKLLMEDEYDGIKELNNFMPPWLQVMFWGTIIWAPIYLWYYHFGGGMLMEEEYYAEVRDAQKEQERRAAQNPQEAFDITKIQVSTDAKDIEEGGKLFVSKTCSACHGEHGQGAAVGPNLTDDYWLNGGSVQEIFQTIQNGRPDKGMPAWKESISPKQIVQIISFIKSNHGKSFPNAKEPQGKLYEEKK